MRPPIEDDAQVLRRLGIEVHEDLRQEEITLSLRVGEDMLNASGRCHGGILFSLADTAAAYATFTEFNRAPVTVSAEIRYLNSARLGDVVAARVRASEATGNRAAFVIELRRGGGDETEVLAEAKATCLMSPSA